MDKACTPPGRGMYFEDFAVGDRFETGTRTVTGDDIRAFARLSGDTNPLHVDAAFAATTPYGRPIAHGLLGLSIVTGLLEELGIFSGTALAFLGIRDWSFRAPIFPGDVLHTSMTIVAKRVSASDPSRGILTRQYHLLNADGNVVQEGTTTVLVRCRGAAPSAKQSSAITHVDVT